MKKKDILIDIKNMLNSISEIYNNFSNENFIESTTNINNQIINNENEDVKIMENINLKEKNNGNISIKYKLKINNKIVNDDGNNSLDEDIDDKETSKQEMFQNTLDNLINVNNAANNIINNKESDNIGNKISLIVDEILNGNVSQVNDSDNNTNGNVVQNIYDTLDNLSDNVKNIINNNNLSDKVSQEFFKLLKQNENNVDIPISNKKEEISSKIDKLDLGLIISNATKILSNNESNSKLDIHPIAKQVFKTIFEYVSSNNIDKSESVNNLKLKLYPSKLGNIDIKLNVKYNSLNVELITSNYSVKDLLEKTSNQLINMFDDKNSKNLNINVSVNLNNNQSGSNENKNFNGNYNLNPGYAYISDKENEINISGLTNINNNSDRILDIKI